MSNFTTAQLAQFQKELTEAFHYHDKDSDGKIPAKEIGDVLKAVGQYPTKDEEKTLLKDHSDGKFVVAKQFYAMVKSHQSANENWEDELREAFLHFDEDGSGTIDTQEIVHAMTKIGQKLTQKQAEEFVREADVDGDGEIDYNEFVAMLTSGRKDATSLSGK